MTRKAVATATLGLLLIVLVASVASQLYLVIEGFKPHETGKILVTIFTYQAILTLAVITLSIAFFSSMASPAKG